MFVALASSVVVTILTTNVADTVGQGEWSFAAWVEVDGRPFLFDTGWSPETVRDNAAALGIDLSRAEDLILSHNHGDHTGGLETLRRELRERNPKALSRIHVAEGIFWSRPGAEGERNPMVALKSRLDSLGSTFIVHDGAAEIAPGVWLTGPVPRKYDEKNYPLGPDHVVAHGDETTADDIPESQSLVIETDEGPVVISGCGHAGLVNTLEHVEAKVSHAPPQAAIGGFHIYDASEEVLRFTAEKLKAMKLAYFLGSHCTGLESTFRIRELAGLDRDHAIVGAIGTKFISGRGIEPGDINR